MVTVKSLVQDLKIFIIYCILFMIFKMFKFKYSSLMGFSVRPFYFKMFALDSTHVLSGQLDVT